MPTRRQPVACSGPSRRRVLQVGACGILGLSLPDLLAASANGKQARADGLPKPQQARIEKQLKRRHATLNAELVASLALEPRGIPVSVSRAGANLEEVLASAPKVQNRVPEGATWDGKSDLPPDEASFREMLSDRDPQAAPLHTPAVPPASTKTGT